MWPFSSEEIAPSDFILYSDYKMEVVVKTPELYYPSSIQLVNADHSIYELCLFVSFYQVQQ